MLRCVIIPDQETSDVMVEVALHSKENRRNQKVLRIVYVAMAVLLFALELFSMARGEGPSVVLTVFAVLLLGVVAWGVEPLCRFRLRGAAGRIDDEVRSARREYVLSDEGVSVESKYGSGEWIWDAFEEWGMCGRYLYLRRVDHEVIVINTDALSSDARTELGRLMALSGVPHGEDIAAR